MKKTILMLYTCTLILCSIFGGCQLPDDTKTGRFVPGDAESALSGLSSEQRAEIKNLYGCYWTADKTQCVEISSIGFSSYSPFMSRSYTKLEWKQENGNWCCYSYSKAENERHTKAEFIKNNNDSITVTLYVIPMDNKMFGPFAPGKQVEQITEEGKTFYVYDKRSPKMQAPVPF